MVSGAAEMDRYMTRAMAVGLVMVALGSVMQAMVHGVWSWWVWWPWVLLAVVAAWTARAT
jgi:hypothetical protein